MRVSIPSARFDDTPDVTSDITPGCRLAHPWQRGLCEQDYAGLITAVSSADRPFHAIWTPMQSRMKAMTRNIP